MVSRRGETFEFNVFSATLGCSRMHKFVYSKTRTRDDLLSCWLATISFFGGVPEEWLTDNMSAIVSVNIFSTNYATFLPPFPLPHVRHSRYRRCANSGYRSGARSGCSSSLTSLSL